MVKTYRKASFSSLYFALTMLCLQLLSQNTEAAQALYASHQCIDMVLTVNSIKYCETDSVAVTSYTCFEQDATATHIPFQNPFPAELPHRNDNMVSERSQHGIGYKKIRSLYLTVFQDSNISLFRKRSHAPPFIFDLPVSLHLKSTILRI